MELLQKGPGISGGNRPSSEGEGRSETPETFQNIVINGQLIVHKKR
jgi:hypothetical protein